MSVRIRDLLIVVGFVLAYLGAMGILLMLSSVSLNEEMLAIVRTVLGLMLAGGAVLLAIGRLAPERDA